jgi:hypothetical protein
MSNPRPLSDYEYGAFMNEVRPQDLPLPQWGAIVEWDGRYVLVFQRPDLNFDLTDISGGVPYGDRMVSIADLLPTMDLQYTSDPSIDWYALPASFNSLVQSIATSVGTAAGGLLAPTFTVPLIAVGIAALLIYMPRPRRAA